MKSLSLLAALLIPLLWAGCSSGPETSTMSDSPMNEMSDESAPVTHVNADQAKTLVDQSQELVVLDVRTVQEYNDGHIPGALNFDFNSPDFAKEIEQLDKNKVYLVHCAAGGRSTRSLTIFESEGFRKIYHLDGGLNAWKSQLYPVVQTGQLP